MTLLYYHHADFLNHDTGPGHPECADRLRVIDEALSQPNFNSVIQIEAPLPNDVEEKLALIHTPAMISRVLTGIPEQGLSYFDADTVASPGTKTAALPGRPAAWRCCTASAAGTSITTSTAHGSAACTP